MPLRERTSPEQPSNDPNLGRPGHPTADLIAQSLVNDDTLPVPAAGGDATQTQDAESEPPEEDKLVQRPARPGRGSSRPTRSVRAGACRSRPRWQSRPASSLSNAERNAFREIARALGARLGRTRHPRSPNRMSPPAADRTEAADGRRNLPPCPSCRPAMTEFSTGCRSASWSIAASTSCSPTASCST